MVVKYIYDCEQHRTRANTLPNFPVAVACSYWRRWKNQVSGTAAWVCQLFTVLLRAGLMAIQII